MIRPLAVAVGDAAGVGPQVALDALAELRPEGGAIVFGDAARLAPLVRERGLEARLVDAGALSDGDVARHAPSSVVGAQALRALDAAIDSVLAGDARALVTGPVSKEAIVASGTPFKGQTEHLARRAGLEDDAVTMMFLGRRLRIALATTHASVRDAATSLRVADVVRSGRHLAEALSRLGVAAPRIDVTGVNPHAGEGGLFGDEEIRVVGPACDRLRSEASAGVVFVGPRAAEASLREAAEGKVDGVVAMLHDQATIASKLLDWGQAVNVTWGLPFVRTSVDHGVAFDAAAKGGGDHDGMLAALRLACQLVPR